MKTQALLLLSVWIGPILASPVGLSFGLNRREGGSKLSHGPGFMGTPMLVDTSAHSQSSPFGRSEANHKDGMISIKIGSKHQELPEIRPPTNVQGNDGFGFPSWIARAFRRYMSAYDGIADIKAPAIPTSTTKAKIDIRVLEDGLENGFGNGNRFGSLGSTGLQSHYNWLQDRLAKIGARQNKDDLPITMNWSKPKWLLKCILYICCWTFFLYQSWCIFEEYQAKLTNTRSYLSSNSKIHLPMFVFCAQDPLPRDLNLTSSQGGSNLTHNVEALLGIRDFKDPKEWTYWEIATVFYGQCFCFTKIKPVTAVENDFTFVLRKDAYMFIMPPGDEVWLTFSFSPVPMQKVDLFVDKDYWGTDVLLTKTTLQLLKDCHDYTTSDGFSVCAQNYLKNESISSVPCRSPAYESLKGNLASSRVMLSLSTLKLALIMARSLESSESFKSSLDTLIALLSSCRLWMKSFTMV
eukprot:maker-scaffold206_size259025-snap-gene-1.18 protein:Tk10930 transcript:maker-scaffold206_size259025-snap-gene-1.18-mRNA-1 annotation:"abc family transporter: pleiotropic drug"